MKKNLLLGFGASALAAMALTACSGGTAAAPVSAPQSETATATPTPVKQYSNEELVSLVSQIKASDGSSLSAVSGEELAGRYQPLRDTLGKTTIEPAACKDLSAVGVPQTIAGSTSAGSTRVKTDGVFTDLTLTSGVDVELLEAKLDASKSKAEECSQMTFSSSGQSIKSTTEKFAGIGSVPGTIAFKTAMVLPDGTEGIIYTAHVVKDGVLISATASSDAAETGGPAAAGALLDQSAALIK